MTEIHEELNRVRKAWKLYALMVILDLTEVPVSTESRSLICKIGNLREASEETWAMVKTALEERSKLRDQLRAWSVGKPRPTLTTQLYQLSRWLKDYWGEARRHGTGYKTMRGFRNDASKVIALLEGRET